MPEEAMTMQIQTLLRPWLGSMIVEHTPLCQHAASVLARYGKARVTFAELCSEVEEVLFDELYDALGERMTLRLDDGRETRIWLRMLPDLADMTLRALFELLPVYSGNYRALSDHMLTTGSLSAMRVLYERYRTFLSAEDAGQLRRVLLERYPGDHDWLAE